MTVVSKSTLATLDLCPESSSVESVAVSYLSSVYGAANIYEKENPKVATRSPKKVARDFCYRNGGYNFSPYGRGMDGG